MCYCRIERIKAVYQLCDDNFVEPLGQNFTDDSFLTTIRDVGLRLNDSISLCKWHGNIHECDKIYKPNIAEDGLCYTFNVLNSRQIYRDMYVEFFNLIPSFFVLILTKINSIIDQILELLPIC